MAMGLIPWRRKREHGNGGSTPLMRFRNEMDTLFDRFLRDPWSTGFEGSPLVRGGTFPRTDVAETENDITVTMEVPGVDAKDVEINVSGGMLTVRGEKRQEREEKQKNYFYVEREYGTFHRSVPLPSTVDPDQVEATHKDGVLTIQIAKRPEGKLKRIEVKTG